MIDVDEAAELLAFLDQAIEYRLNATRTYLDMVATLRVDGETVSPIDLLLEVAMRRVADLARRDRGLASAILRTAEDPVEVLRHLAVGYPDAPGFRNEWAVGSGVD